MSKTKDISVAYTNVRKWSFIPNSRNSELKWYIKMKIAIIGTGGIGGYFGAKLVQAGYDVTFIARGEHLKTIQNSGLVIKSILGDFKVENLKATDKIKEIDNPDLIIICVKAWQIKEIRDDIKMVLNNDTMILPLQNGVLASDELSENIDKKNILGGLCRIISKIDSQNLSDSCLLIGNTISSDGEPLCYASIEIFNTTDSTYLGTFSDSLGNFRINVPANNYRICFKYMNQHINIGEYVLKKGEAREIIVQFGDTDKYVTYEIKTEKRLSFFKRKKLIKKLENE